MKFASKYKLLVVIIIVLIVPIALNFILQIKINCDCIIGDPELWLSTWISYTNTISSIVMVIFAYRTLIMSKQQMDNSLRIWEEERRANLKVDIIKQWDHYYYLRFRNCGHEDAYNIMVSFNGSLCEQLGEEGKEVFTSINRKPFFIPANDTQLFQIEDSTTFEQKCTGNDFRLCIDGKYNNDKYSITEELVINEFIAKMSGNPDERFEMIAKIWFEQCVMNKDFPHRFSILANSVADIKKILGKYTKSVVKDDCINEGFSLNEQSKEEQQ